MVIVDSSIWIDALYGIKNAHTIWLKSALGKREIGLTSLILTEVLQGVRSEIQFKGFQRDLMLLPIFETIETSIAVTAAHNYRALRNRGITVRSSIDCVIATFCIENGFDLLHNDRDYQPFEHHLGLRVIDPSASPAP